MFLIKDAIAFAAINVGYFTALELNPKTKGVVIRPDSDNNRVFSFSSMKEFMISPFKCRPATNQLWKPNNWDINYPVAVGGCFAVYKCLGF